MKKDTKYSKFMPSSFALNAATLSESLSTFAYADDVDSYGGVWTLPRSYAKPSLSSVARKSRSSSTGRRRVAVLVCPAQLCVANDYKVLFDNLSLLYGDDELNVEIAGSSRAAPLCRRGWMSIARNLHRKEFFQGNLPVRSTLQRYFQAIEQGLAEIFDAEGPDVNICMIGHSVGGWVARAYLGGLSQPKNGHGGFLSSEVHRLALKRCSSFITLGTPHIAPEDAWIDQTRGLIRAIDESPSCSPQALVDKGIDITCVCSEAIMSDVTSMDAWKQAGAEGILAAHSYLPMTGMSPKVKGDGIVPLHLAFLEEPAKRVVLDRCSVTGRGIRHSHVVPTPWNLWDPSAPSTRLPAHEVPSYVTRGVVAQWAHYIR